MGLRLEELRAVVFTVVLKLVKNADFCLIQKKLQ